MIVGRNGFNIPETVRILRAYKLRELNENPVLNQANAFDLLGKVGYETETITAMLAIAELERG